MQFSRLIQLSRIRLALSQEQLASGLGVKQSTVSAWETGRQLPDPSLLPRIAECLQLNPEELALVLADQRDRPEDVSDYSEQPEIILTEDRYLREQDIHISRTRNSLPGANVDIWLLGPSTLPILDSAPFRRHWAKNLRAGSNYCVLWLPEITRHGSLSKLAGRLREVGQLVEGGAKGEIRHYLLDHSFATQPTKRLSRQHRDQPSNGWKNTIIDEYNGLIASANTYPNNTFFPPCSITKELRKDLAQWFTPYGSIVIYVPTGPISALPNPYVLAALFIRDVFVSLSSSKGEAFFFFDYDRSLALCSVIQRFQNEVAGLKLAEPSVTSQSQEPTSES